MIKVKGHNHLYKTESGAIVNVDSNSYKAALERIEKEKKIEKIDKLETRLDRIESLLERLLDVK